MALEYQTAVFEQDQSGLEERMRWINAMGVQGWRVASESIDPGHYKGGQACCLATVCLPMGFLAGRTSGSIRVTLCREGDGLGKYCTSCGNRIASRGAYCGRCGMRQDASAHPSMTSPAPLSPPLQLGVEEKATSATGPPPDPILNLSEGPEEPDTPPPIVRDLILLALVASLLSPIACSSHVRNAGDVKGVEKGVAGRIEGTHPPSDPVDHLRLARYALSTGLTVDQLEEARRHLDAIPLGHPDQSAALRLKELVGRQGEPVVLPDSAAAAKHRLMLPQIALRKRQTVESIIGFPRSAEKVKYSSPMITLANYAWGDAYYQEGRLTGVERRFPLNATPASVYQALRTVGLELTSLPEEHDQYYSWSAGPSTQRHDSIINPLVCCSFGYNPAWVSVRRDRRILWVDFDYLDQRGSWPKRTQDAWDRFD